MIVPAGSKSHGAAAANPTALAGVAASATAEIAATAVAIAVVAVQRRRAERRLPNSAISSPSVGDARCHLMGLYGFGGAEYPSSMAFHGVPSWSSPPGRGRTPVIPVSGKGSGR